MLSPLTESLCPSSPQGPVIGLPRGIYSVRFIAATLSTGLGLTSTYVVPAGKVAIIRFANFDVLAGPCTARLSITTIPGSAVRRLIGYTAQPTDAILWWDGRAVVNAGETITAQNATAGSTVLSSVVSGYLLTA